MHDMGHDFNSDFEREMRLWRRNAQIEAVKQTAKFFALALGVSAICVFWIAVLWGFLTTQY